MAVNNSWRQPQTLNDWMRDIEKRLMHEERRPTHQSAASLVGPGISTYSKLVQDWNSEGPIVDGFFYSDASSVINSPDDSRHWMGIVQANAIGQGLQRVWEYIDTAITPSPDPTVYTRAFVTNENGTRNYSPWLAGGGGGSGGGGKIIVQDEGITVVNEAVQLDFQGAGVVASAGTGEAIITVDGVPRGTAGGDLTGTYPSPTLSAAGLSKARPEVADEGVVVVNDATKLNFIGPGVTAAPDGSGGANITVNSADSAPPIGPAGGVLTGTYPNPGLADNTVTSAKIVDKTIQAIDIADGVIPTIPTSLPPSGPAGGVLSGTYPNPQLVDGGVTSVKIADGTIAVADLAPATVSALVPDVLDEGITTVTDVNKFNFVGAGVTVTPDGTGGALVTIPSGAVAGVGQVGEIALWGTNVAPGNWLLCDGRSVLRTDYPDLFNAIGTTYGSADATHFNLPNLAGRFPIGRDAAQTEFDVLGEQGGEKTHTLDVSEMPTHSHPLNNHYHDMTHGHTGNVGMGGQHGHDIRSGPAGSNNNQVGTGSGTWSLTNQPVQAVGQHDHGLVINNAVQSTGWASDLGIANAGAGLPHNNLPPYLTINYIIRYQMTAMQPGTIAVQDEHAAVSTTTTILDFVGAGVTAADAGGGKVTVTIPNTGVPTGPAGGDLTGTYPNPTIGTGKVTSAAIADGTIVDGDVAAANKDGAAATPSMRTLGTGAQQAAAGNDPRLSDARTPTAHATTHQPGGSDPMQVDAAAGTGSLRTLGPGSAQAMPGNSRLDQIAASNPATADINVANQKVTNSADPTADQDVVNLRTMKAAIPDILDEGGFIMENPTELNFVGPGVTATRDGSTQRAIITVSGGGTGGGAGTVPVGSILPHAGSTPPTGYLFCDGSAISRTSYPELFAAIGTTYGAGNGSSTFNLPNLTGKVPVGLSGVDTEFNTLGKTGGEKAHTLTAAELPDHTHQYQYSTSIQSLLGYYNQYAVNASWVASSGWNPQNATGPTGGAGWAQGAHNNIQPYLTTNWIIRYSPSTETPVSMQAFRDVLDANFTPTATTAGTSQQVPGYSITVNVTSAQQVWTVEVAPFCSLAAGGNLNIDLTVDGTAQTAQGTIVVSGPNGGYQSPAKTYMISGLTPGSHTFGVKAYYTGTAGNLLGATSSTITAVGSMVGVDQTTDWRLTDFRASDFALTTTSQIIPFTQDKGGSGFVTDGSGRLVVQKAGVYFIHTAFTVMQTGGTGLAWAVNNLVHRRGGVEQSRRENVVSTQPGGFATAVLTGEYDCNAGDTFEVLANSQAASTHIVNNGRGQFTGHRLAGPGPTGPPGPTGIATGIQSTFTGPWYTTAPAANQGQVSFNTPAGTLFLTVGCTAWSSGTSGIGVDVYVDGVFYSTCLLSATSTAGAWMTLPSIALSRVVTAGPHYVGLVTRAGTNSDTGARGSIFGFVI